MRITIESALLQPLKADGRPWDGPGGPCLPAAELAVFFALDLSRQLERLIATGPPPVPPDAFARLLVDGRTLAETGDEKSFDPRWRGEAASEPVDLEPGARLLLQVWDRDLLFHDLVGELAVTVPPSLPADGRWQLGPFDQVRTLVLQLR